MVRLFRRLSFASVLSCLFAVVATFEGFVLKPRHTLHRGPEASGVGMSLCNVWVFVAFVAKEGGKVCRRVSLSRFFLAAVVCFVFVSFCFVLRRCVLPFPCLHILPSPLSSDLCGMPQVIFIRFHAAWAVLTVLLFFVSIFQFIHPALSASS